MVSLGLWVEAVHVSELLDSFKFQGRRARVCRSETVTAATGSLSTGEAASHNNSLNKDFCSTKTSVPADSTVKVLYQLQWRLLVEAC